MAKTRTCDEIFADIEDDPRNIKALGKHKKDYDELKKKIMNSKDSKVLQQAKNTMITLLENGYSGDIHRINMTMVSSSKSHAYTKQEKEKQEKTLSQGKAVQTRMTTPAAVTSNTASSTASTATASTASTATTSTASTATASDIIPASATDALENQNQRTNTHKIVCVVDLNKSEDEENELFAKRIAENKQEKGHDAQIIQVRGNAIKQFNKTIRADTTQLVIAAHSRFYKKGGKDVAELKPYEKNVTRHVGEYMLDEVAEFVLNVIKMRPNITEIKFYSCESATNKQTNTGEYEKEKNNMNRVKLFTISSDTMEEYKKALNNKHQYGDLSNLQIMIQKISELAYFENGPRHILFQGLNGLGYMSTDKKSPVKSFHQKDIGFYNDLSKKNKLDEFEAKYVDTKSTVDKIQYEVDIGGAKKGPSKKQ